MPVEHLRHAVERPRRRPRALPPRLGRNRRPGYLSAAVAIHTSSKARFCWRNPTPTSSRRFQHEIALQGKTGVSTAFLQPSRTPERHGGAAGAPTGRAWLPLDPGYPLEPLKLLIEGSRPAVLLGDRKARSWPAGGLHCIIRQRVLRSPSCISFASIQHAALLAPVSAERKHHGRENYWQA